MSKALLFIVALGVIVFWIGIFAQKRINNQVKKEQLSPDGRRLSWSLYISLVKGEEGTSITFNYSGDLYAHRHSNSFWSNYLV